MCGWRYNCKWLDTKGLAERPHTERERVVTVAVQVRTRTAPTCDTRFGLRIHLSGGRDREDCDGKWGGEYDVYPNSLAVMCWPLTG